MIGDCYVDELADAIDAYLSQHSGGGEVVACVHTVSDADDLPCDECKNEWDAERNFESCARQQGWGVEKGNTSGRYLDPRTFAAWVGFSAALAHPRPVVLEVTNNRTIYDHRTKVDGACADAAPRLYSALKNLLDAVEERPGLRKSIESVTISAAHVVLQAATPTTNAGRG